MVKLNIEIDLGDNIDTNIRRQQDLGRMLAGVAEDTNFRWFTRPIRDAEGVEVGKWIMSDFNNKPVDNG